MNLKKKLSNYFTKRLNKKMDQEKVGEYKYFKLANGKVLLETDGDIICNSQFELFEFISNSVGLQKDVIAEMAGAKYKKDYTINV